MSLVSLYETELFYWFYSLASFNSLAGEVIVFFAAYGVFIIIAALLGFAAITIIPRYRHLFGFHAELVLFALVSGIFARFAVKNFITFFYSRQRPFEILSDIQPLFAVNSGEAFPSGHAIFFFAVAAAVAFYYPRVSAVFFLGAFLFSVIRIVAGAHWPSDILAGAILGILTSALFRYFFLQQKKKMPGV